MFDQSQNKVLYFISNVFAFIICNGAIIVVCDSMSKLLYESIGSWQTLKTEASRQKKYPFEKWEYDCEWK